jgi:hypothetical protein
MITKDKNGQYYENGVPVFTLGQVCKIINYPFGRNIMIRDFQTWRILLKRNEPSERMKATGYFIYHLHEYKTKSGVKMAEPIVLVRIEGVAFLKKYVKRKIAALKN